MISNKELDFPLKGSVTLQDINKAKDRLLQMAIVVRDCLEENHIDYFMRAGTLLGAVRHTGFIPWELDFDIAVMEEDYDEAMDVLSEGIPEWMIIQNRETDPNYCAFWSKVVDRNSVVTSTEYESDNKFTFRGLHIDVYKIKHTSPNNYNRDLLTDNLEYYGLKYQRGLISKSDYDKLVTEIKNSINNLPPRKAEELTQCYFLHFMHTDKNNIFPLKQYSFENEMFYGPNNYDQMLKERYGDYETVPEYENRKLKISSIEFLK